MRVGGFGVLLAGLGLVFGAAGCGTQVAGSGGQDNALAAAVSHTTAQTARVAITSSMREQSMTTSFTATGVFDFAHARGTLTMGAPIKMTEIFLPGKMYIKPPSSGGMGLSKGKTWLVISGADSGAAMAGGPLSIFGGTSSPADLLASLTAISGGEKKVGTTTIRGVPVTEYQVNVDPAKAAARLPSAERASFRQFAKMLGSGTIPVHVWVDSKNLVRRVQMTLNPLAAAAGSPASFSPSDLPSGFPSDLPSGFPSDLPSGFPSDFPSGLPTDLPSGAVSAGPGFSMTNLKVSVSTDYYDFGVPVHVSAPPAAQVTSMPSLPSMPSAKAPKVSGTLTPAQKAAAGQAATAFWTAAGTNDPAAVGRTVLPGQKACVESSFRGGPKITVSSFRIVSVEPAGQGKATVRYKVAATATMGGQAMTGAIPAHTVLWMSEVERGSHWYADLNGGSILTSFCG